ncbi:MAG: hypothetical protein DMG64_05925 [Acidobacteria bacterium]|nr:MAG: hypothetical protein DMG63_03095 [Acidobacteriota bacterium]PYY03996.1 MAG: hypothetical protein DMG64_05925 [Acidobacteriota bacterium]
MIAPRIGNEQNRARSTAELSIISDAPFAAVCYRRSKINLRRRFVKIVIRAAIAMLLACFLSAALPAQPKSSFSPSKRTQESQERREHHPHIRSAIRELEEAKRELQAAAHDFGGHRLEALKACDEAIHQLHSALPYDKK